MDKNEFWCHDMSYNMSTIELPLINNGFNSGVETMSSLDSLPTNIDKPYITTNKNLKIEDLTKIYQLKGSVAEFKRF